MSRSINKDRLPELFRRLAACGPLYLPLVEGPVTAFKPWSEGAQLDLDAVSSTIAPKELFLPRDEVYLEYARRGEKLQLLAVEQPAGQATAFGVRPCDLKAIELLDRVFIRQEPPDRLYLDRRERTAVVALACRRPDPFCFCTVYGVNPLDAPGTDIIAWDLGEELVMAPRTPRGEELFALAGALLTEKAGAWAPAPVETANFNLDLAGLPERLRERFEDPAWDRLCRSCLGCGACTYLCPTCHCFEIQDFGHHEKGQRFRCWDSCIFGQYTLMAGGHNPRPTRRERLRNRFLHKLQYFPENYGEFGCVGCGRCLRSCPVHLDIVCAIRLLEGESVAMP